jgi:alkaline phosphatase D
MEGYQFFGRVAIDGRTRLLTVSLRDLDGTISYQVTLEPDRHRH